MAILSPIRFTGAKVLRDGALERGALTVEDGRIGKGDDIGRAVDLSGYMILPGIVDMNMGGLARLGGPGVPLPPGAGLCALAREAASHGISTGWVAQGWSWVGGIEGPEAACATMAALKTHPTQIDLRLQLRVETHMPDSRDALVGAIAAHGVDQVIFTDTLPEAVQMSQRASHRIAAWAEREGRSVEDFIARLRAAKEAASDVPRHLLALAEAFDRGGVVYGSHDDPDGETRDRMGQLGAKLAEYPLRAGAAAVARANRHPIVFCAADLLRAGPRPGGVSTMALITKGMGDALSSRDHPAAMAEAAFALADQGIRSLPEAWAMISAAPAGIMGLADRGRIAPGLRADLTIVNSCTRAVEATLVAGQIAYLTGDLALRLIAARPGLALAAE